MFNNVRNLEEKMAYDLAVLDRQMHNCLTALELEGEKSVQEASAAAALKAMYKQWQAAVIELEANQVPAVNLEAVLNGDQQLLKDFLMEPEFKGFHNPLTLAAEKFFASNLNPQTMRMLVNRAFDRLSENSELFYLEPDAKGDTVAELLLQALQQAPAIWSPEQKVVCEEIVNKLLAQALKDACIAIDKKDANTLEKLVSLGRSLLDKPTMDGQALFNKMMEAGYEELLANFQQPAPDAERHSPRRRM